MGYMIFMVMRLSIPTVRLETRVIARISIVLLLLLIVLVDFCNKS